MAIVIAVDDPGDERLADYVGLTDAEARRRREVPGDAPGFFVAEGVTTIRRLVTSPYRVRSVLVTDDRRRALADSLEAVDAPVYVAPREVLAAVVGFDLHRGAVAAADRVPLPPPAAVLDGALTIALLEGINDHENLGAIGRSAAGLGVDGLLLDPTCADPLYRRSVRVSMGELLHLPFTRLDPWPQGLDEVAAAGFRTVALTPAADARDIGQLAVPPHERLALLLGAEGAGLSAAALARADERVRIPLRPGVDSLNVGHAAAIAFHLVASQR